MGGLTIYDSTVESDWAKRPQWLDARAASLAVKHKITGYQYSLFDIATNREISDDDKQSVLRYVLDDEDKRAVCSGDRDFNKKRGEVVAYIENVLGIPVTK